MEQNREGAKSNCKEDENTKSFPIKYLESNSRREYSSLLLRSFTYLFSTPSSHTM